jgi:hypothetical protein
LELTGKCAVGAEDRKPGAASAARAVWPKHLPLLTKDKLKSVM